MSKIAGTITNLATLPIECNEFLYDTFLAAGEDNNANGRIFHAKNGLNARYVHPKEAGIIVSSEPGNARILPSSYDKLEELRDSEEILVIPGFFGVTVDGQICTFSRGGSDISGSVGRCQTCMKTLLMLMYSAAHSWRFYREMWKLMLGVKADWC